jgi:hypothetical protein
MTRNIHLLLPAALLGAAACSDQGFTERRDPINPDDLNQPACIEVDPANIRFDDVEIADEDYVPQERTVTVSNTCDGDLQIESVELGPNAPAGVFGVSGIEDFLIGAGESSTFVVTFDPATDGEFNARILVDSNAEDNPTEAVRVQGRGVAPRIKVTPETYEYGEPYIGCETGQPFQIINEGTADLVVSDIEVFTPSLDEYSLDLNAFENGNLPFTVAPYDTSAGGPAVDVFLDYLPLDTFEDPARIDFTSNDPLRTVATVNSLGSGTLFGQNTDPFEQPIRSATDILFTLDRSGSMYDNNENVVNNFDVFIQTLTNLEADFHAGVVVGDVGCIAGSDPYIDASFSESRALDAFSTMADIDRVLVPYGRNEERGFMQAEAALGKVGAGECNSEFYRDDAFLSIVHVSDEPEQSVNTWSFYVGLFQSLKADPEDVKVNAVAGDYPTGCGSASAGTGYYEASVATGGLFLSICATDWAEKLENLATESVSINDSFELSLQPVPQTIEVVVDGVRSPTGWEYEVSSNSVVFDTDFIPAGGSTIEISYQVLPDCEG